MSTLQSLIDLGGYGRYVWPAYGLSFLLMLLEPWLVHRRVQRALASRDGGEGDA